MGNVKSEDEMAELCRLTVKNIINDDSHAAYGNLNELVSQFSGYFEQNVLLNRLESPEKIDELNDLLTVLAGALEVRDTVLICDLLEYELLPFLSYTQETV